MRHTCSIVALTAVLSCQPVSAFAWDEAGHRIVAAIADHYLAPAARTKVQGILAADPDPTGPRDLAAAAVWESKNPATGHAGDWHFLHASAGRPNIPVACNGHAALPARILASAGPVQACIVDKINQFSRELADAGTSAGERGAAVKFLASLVADIHQPLRVVDEGNNHGRGLGVTAAGMSPGNLFGFWEEVAVSRLAHGENPGEVAERLISQISPALERQWSSSTPQLWALESYQLGVDRGYGMVRAYDSEGRIILQEPQVEQAVDITALQLSRAGVRLAYEINKALAPETLPTPQKIAAQQGDATTGQRFAAKACGGCHVLAPTPATDTMAPDFSSIANTDGMSAVAIRQFLFGPHPTMPNIRLSPKQADDLTAYILTLKTRR